MTSNNLLESKLMNNITLKMKDILQEQTIISDEGKLQKKSNYVEPEHEYYAKYVFKRCMNIINTIEQLEYIPIFMKNFHDSHSYKENEINHPKYLQYHLENHYMKVSTLFDQGIILVSEIYRLGIPPKFLSFKYIKHNRLIKSKPCIETLGLYEKSIQDIKMLRNQITHRGEFEDDELDLISMYYFVSEKEIDDEHKVVDVVELKDNMQSIVNRKASLCQSNNKAISNIFIKLFDELTADFLKISTQLKSNVS